MSFLDRWFGDSGQKELRTIRPLVQAINDRADACKDADLAAEISALKLRVADGASLDDVLVEVFALVREASDRTLSMRHYDVQLIGGMLLHRGKITEMRTGEGKTLMATLSASLNALSGEGVHVITVNDYLARRDAVWMGQVYAALGLTVSVINQGYSYVYDPNHQDKDEERDEVGSFKVVHDFLRECTRQEAYQADITYGTNSEFGFDYLRDHTEHNPENIRQHSHPYAIIDEIDSILIDEARTPLIISAPAATGEDLYSTFAAIAKQLQPETHFTVDEKTKSATLTDAGVELAERSLGIDNIYTQKGIKQVHHLETAVRAQAIYTKDKEYVVRDGEVVIVDEFTGRLQPGRRWSDGLHQAVEAKEGVKVQQESKTMASITYQNYFRMYDKLSGMTGTALTSQEEFYTVYGLTVVPVPTHKEVARIDRNDLIYQTEPGKFTAIIEKVKQVHETEQPILIGTASIEVNERLSVALSKAGLKHQMLNAKNHESEGEIVAAAGIKGAITLATNMAGRGVDIKLGGPLATPEQSQAVKDLGGLFVLGTERHEARRIDNQLRGRSGRQGDPGETQFFVSLDDALMRVFGGERVQRLMGTFNLPEDEPIEMKMISNTLERAQTRIEGHHFDARKQVLAYDDILNQQRQTLYARRQKILLSKESAVEGFISEVTSLFPEASSVIEKQRTVFGAENFKEVVRRMSLQIIDMLWVEHLEVMSYTRSSVSLRAYGQRDPLIEYRKEGARLFVSLEEAILERFSKLIAHVQPAAAAPEQKKEEEERSLTVDLKSIARNDQVTVTNGTETQTLKFKKAEPLLRQGWTVVKEK